MKIVFTWKELLVMSEDRIIKRFKAHCNVRHELNGLRKPNEVIKTYPFENTERLPYYPRQFPSGIHKIISVEYTDEKYFAPVKIRTDAIRQVFQWEVENGEYIRSTSNIINDTGYLIHYYNGKYSHGCILTYSKGDVLELAQIIKPELISHGYVLMEVI
jgi:hypothetical protein